MDVLVTVILKGILTVAGAGSWIFSRHEKL